MLKFFDDEKERERERVGDSVILFLLFPNINNETLVCHKLLEDAKQKEKKKFLEENQYLCHLWFFFFMGFAST